jgi:hypothetical protein
MSLLKSLMNVVISSEPRVADRTWYDAATGLLYVEASGLAGSLRLADLPEEDFESKAPLSGFELGQSGSVVVCRHEDGEETWFPVDMWWERLPS